MAKVAFIGLGVMGYPMARHLAQEGRARAHRLQPHRRRRRRNGSAEHGGRRADTPRAAAEGADFVFSCVGNDDDLRSVDARRRRRARRHDARARSTSTTRRPARPSRASSRAAAEKRGVGFLDAPVSGGQAGAENGQLTVMVGGDQATFDKAKPVIDAYAKMVGLMGPVGAGQLTKMVNQICIAGLVQGLAEGIHFAKKAGPRRGEGDRRHLQGRGAVLADGEPLEDDERGQVRLRLRRRLDAQGPRRSASTRRARTARSCRSPRWSTSSTPRCRRWAAGAGTRRA